MFVDLSCRGLVSLDGVPEETKVLNLEGNRLEEWPELPVGLREIHLCGNRLRWIPSLRRFRSLRILHLCSNRLVELPELPSGLEELYVHKNPLEDLSVFPEGLRLLHLGDCLPVLKPSALPVLGLNPCALEGVYVSPGTQIVSKREVEVREASWRTCARAIFGVKMNRIAGLVLYTRLNGRVH